MIEEAQLVPKEEGEDGVGAQAEIGSTYTLVHAQNALCPSCLQQSVQDSPVHEALERVGGGRSWSEPTRGFTSAGCISGCPTCNHNLLHSPPSFPCLPVPQNTPLPCPEHLWAGYRAWCWLRQKVSWPRLLQCHSPWQLLEPPSSSGQERSTREKEFCQPTIQPLG